MDTRIVSILTLVYNLREIRMPRKIIYRRQLIQAAEAFLERTPAAHRRAQNIIRRCSAALRSEEKRVRLDDIIWGSFVKALTDSVFYENEQFLRETREILLGRSSRNIAQTVFSEDYQIYFTTNEAEWYAQLVDIVDFITTIPFTKLYEAAYQARQNKETWETMRTYIPEVVQAEKIEEEYQQRKILIEEISARSPSPENAGDEKIYHLLLREVTNFLTGISVGHAAVYFGYPFLDSSYTVFHNSASSNFRAVNVTESIAWAKKMLEAISGREEIFISWRLSKAATFDGDLLLISLR